MRLRFIPLIAMVGMSADALCAFSQDASAQDASAQNASAQNASMLTERVVPCDGLVISRIDIRRSARTVMDKQRAPGWARAVLQPLLLGAPTRANAIAPFLQLREGATCTERRRAESERVLRLQPYLADAAVRVFDEADGRVRIEVETIDDIRPIIGGGLRDSKPNDVELGNGNIGGSGRLAAARWRDGRAFRDGYGVRFADFHALGGPNLAIVNVAQTPLGSYSQFSMGRPFYTDLQHVAGYAGYVKDDGYALFTRNAGDALSIQTSRERADAGLALRLNSIGRVTYLLGALASSERRSAGSDVVRITDAGFVDTVDAALTGRYRAQQSTRGGVVLGLRALTFAKVNAFDGLEGVQDIARGIQLATTIGKGITGDDRRNYATADFYVGVGSAASFAGLRIQADSRQNAAGWGDGVVSGRLAWYSHPSARQTRIVAVEYAGSSSDSVPYQLTMADAQSGVRGYVGSRLSGGRRVVARVEQRINMPGIARYLGWGLAGFVDAGQMWAAKVPFGEDGFRSSAGLSLLAAVPRASRSVARVEAAYPLVADKHARGVNIRVTYRITGRAFWREPTQIARARRGSPTTDIFSWP